VVELVSEFVCSCMQLMESSLCLSEIASEPATEFATRPKIIFLRQPEPQQDENSNTDGENPDQKSGIRLHLLFDASFVSCNKVQKL